MDETGALDRAEDHLRSGQPHLAFSELEAGAGSAETAHQRLLQGRAALASGRVAEAISLLSEAKQSAMDWPAARQIVLHGSLGAAYAANDQGAASMEAFKRAEAVARTTSDKTALAAASLNVLRAQIEAKDLSELETRFDRAVQLLDSITQPAAAELAVAISDLALRANRELDLSEQYVRAAQEQLQRRLDGVSDDSMRAYVHGYLGLIEEYFGRHEAAIRYAERARDDALVADDLEQAFRWQWLLARSQQVSLGSASAWQSYVAARDLYELGAAETASYERLVAPFFAQYADLLLAQSGQESATETRQQMLRQTRQVLESVKQQEIEDYFASECVGARRETETMGTGVVLVYPVVLQDRLELLVEYDGRYRQFTVDTARGPLTQTVRRLRRNLERLSNDDEMLRDAQQLYRWLVEPYEDLIAENSTLVIVPDGALRTIPLAALHDGERYLVERVGIVSTPAVALTQNDVSESADRLFAGGITESVQGFPALPGVASELDRITQQFASVELRDESFRRAAVEASLAQPQFRQAHLATHGEFRPDYRESFVLMYDDRLTLEQLRSVLQARGGLALDLLVLSACQTAAGDDRAALGLAGVAVQTGVRSAVASLWSISDQATSRLVGEFYQALSAGDSKAESLRSAQVSLLRSDEFSHPRFWAPFLLIGSWM